MNGRLRIALAGNPNSGKTTLFNAMTGAHQRVGNYPGVTVERREGVCRVGGVEIEVVDLPGTYSLTAYTIEERVARDAVLDPNLDLVIDVVDASNADRNFYLTTQLMEIGKPVVIALNMSDVARANGVEMDIERLSALFSAPVVETVGHRGGGVQELLKAAVQRARQKTMPPPPRLRYGDALDAALDELSARADAQAAAARLGVPPRWLALKLLEEDSAIIERVAEPHLREAARALARPLAERAGDRIEVLTADARYGFISGVCHSALRQTAQIRHTRSDRIDAVVTHWLFGIPIFLGMMYAVFRFTFALGEPLMGILEGLFEWLGGRVGGWWPTGSESLLRSLLVDGVIGGVGGVITFLPNILLLFFAISLLEDSGYMARAAFVTDHLMRSFGLQGRSFIPMLLGFGCSVPGIMATRTLEQGRARLATILVLPLMSCGARLTIYALLIPAFFPRHLHARVMWIVYVVGIAAALALARLLRATVLRGDSPPLVIELPPYRWPTLRGALLRMATQSWLYLRKAGTIILGISIVLWALTTFPRRTQFERDYAAEAEAARRAYTAAAAHALRVPLEAAADAAEGIEELADRIAELRGHFDARIAEAERAENTTEQMTLLAARDAGLARLRETAPSDFDRAARYLDEARIPRDEAMEAIALARQMERMNHSFAGRIGRWLEPAIRPLGFDWRIGTALIGAFAAKEVFVAQMGIVFSIGEQNLSTLRERLRAEYSTVTAFSLLLFCLLSAPCMATIAVTRQEAGGWRWAALQFFGLTAVAYAVSLVVYQVGSRIWV